MKAEWSPGARRSLRSIHEYHQEFGTSSASRIVADILDGVEQLTLYPMLGRKLDPGVREGLRVLIVGRYLILYRVARNADKLTVLDVLDSKRLQDPLW